MAEEAEALGAEAEVVDEVVEFALVEGGGEEGVVAFAVGGVRGFAVAELVVEDGRDAVAGGEGCEGDGVVCGC